jgi:hypothetical protein
MTATKWYMKEVWAPVTESVLKAPKDEISDGAARRFGLIYLEAFHKGQDWVQLTLQQVADLSPSIGLRTAGEYVRELDTSDAPFWIEHVIVGASKKASIYHFGERQIADLDRQQIADSPEQGKQAEKTQKPRSQESAADCRSSSYIKKEELTEIPDQEYEEAFIGYPYHRGNKAEGAKRWKSLVESGVEPSTLSAAFKNYAEEIQALGTEKKFVLAITSFLDDRWREWEPTPEPPRKPTLKERFTWDMWGDVNEQYQANGSYTCPVDHIWMTQDPAWRYPWMDNNCFLYDPPSPREEHYANA